LGNRAKRGQPGEREQAAPELPAAGAPCADRLAALAVAIERERANPVADSRTARLLARGIAKMAQKVIEEAGEVAIDAIRDDRPAVVMESADLLYHLTVLWTELKISHAEEWDEMDRRRSMLGLAEKLPKDGLALAS